MNITIIIVLVVAIFVIITYNGLIKKRTFIEEAYSGIDVQLKKRYNIIPNLIKVVKGYTKHETDTLKDLVSARNEAINAVDIKPQEQAEKKLSASLLNMFALAEDYPDLKASENFKQLQNELVNVENDIEKSRRYYNGNVRAYNTSIATVPTTIIAKLFNFKAFDFFEIDDMEKRDYPEVNF